MNVFSGITNILISSVGAKEFFTATVNAIRMHRPHAHIGFYSQGINQAATKGGWPEDVELQWLWELVDVLAPSIYPQSANVTADRASIEATVGGALRSAALVPLATRPAVMPYARALVDSHTKTGMFTPEVLANQVQLPAALGVDAVVLWGSSSDYHGDGCANIAKTLDSFAGNIIAKCVENRRKCADTYCSGHGRCVSQLEDDPTNMLCVGLNQQPKYCLCDLGYPNCFKNLTRL